MLVAIYNVVKVESVPLKANKFTDARGSVESHREYADVILAWRWRERGNQSPTRLGEHVPGVPVGDLPSCLLDSDLDVLVAVLDEAVGVHHQDVAGAMTTSFSVYVALRMGPSTMPRPPSSSMTTSLRHWRSNGGGCPAEA